MIVLFGSSTDVEPLYSGDFHCPTCERSRPFVREAMRKWFTLFFVRLFPFGAPLDDYLRCHACDGVFVLEAEN